MQTINVDKYKWIDTPFSCKIISIVKIFMLIEVICNTLLFPPKQGNKSNSKIRRKPQENLK